MLEHNNPGQLKHRNLTPNERDAFLQLYFEVENQYPIFKFMKKSVTTMYLWLLYVNIFMSYFIWRAFSNELYFYCSGFVLFCSGLLGLQIIFVASHIKSHALFLEYDQHRPHNKKTSCQRPVYFYAFYHHHHSATDDWAKFMSYHTTDQTLSYHSGSRNIITAHWHGFSLISSKIIFLVLLGIYVEPKLVFFFYGYEVGTLLLPFAHGWQHISKKRFGQMRRVMEALEKFGLIANRKAHDKHHEYDIPSVYQDFSSSGIYAKPIDDCLNKYWNMIYHTSIRPHDQLLYSAYLVYFIVFLFVPMFFIIII